MGFVVCGVDWRKNCRKPVPPAHQGTRRVVVLAVDSYADKGSLEWLAANERLKIPGGPTGLAPGEAGVAIVVEPSSTAQPALGFVSKATVRAGAGIPPDGKPDNGRALFEAFKAALSTTTVADVDLIVDLNGESWRAHELASAMALAQSKLDFSPQRTFLPAMGVGELGAAAAPLSLCLALESFRRGYGAREGTVIAALSEHGLVGALRVHRSARP